MGNLVFFCGAGVSYPAGLPSFEGLVKNVYKNLNEERDELEQEAISEGYFDRALGLLEKRSIAHVVRKEIINELTLLDDANLETHKAILELANPKKSKPFLVTTNVDRGFINAGDTSCMVFDEAPKLPIPKPHRWNSVVHLHGLIEEGKSNGDNLIFTSGDFGSAYLTARWASKFITELFRHFTILFVGYSVNDPVVRYMTDAIAAERSSGYDGFNKPYILAHTTPKMRSKNTKVWNGRGIKPIFYSFNHSNLHKTLIEWAKYASDGANAKVKLINKESRIPPLPPYSHEVERLVDILKEKSTSSNEDVTGSFARRFSQLNPPAPIEWLHVFDKYSLLNLSQYSAYVFPVCQNPHYSNQIKPNVISIALWDWMLSHLEEKILVDWIIDKGCHLHSELKDKIAHKILNEPVSEPYLKFWQIITSEFIGVKSSMPGDNSYDCLASLKKGVDPLRLASFLKLLSPYYTIEKPINWSLFGYEESNYSSDKNLYEIDIEIGISRWFLEEIKSLESYPTKFLFLLPSISEILKTALDLFSFIGKGDKWNDRSHWCMSSISPHTQNSGFHNWTYLIAVCRDLWCEVLSEDKETAKIILLQWQKIEYPTFRRLVLFAMTQEDLFDQDQQLDYLLEDDGWWLWSVITRREVYRLLSVLWPKCSSDNVDKLLCSVLKGPPRALYKATLNDAEWISHFERAKWLMLSKLNSFESKLSNDAKNVLNRLEEEHPEWCLREGEQDEFTTWHSSSNSYDYDITLDGLFAKETHELKDFLITKDQKYSEGRLNLLRSGSKDHYEKVIDLLFLLFEEKEWDESIWDAALVGLADCKQDTWSKLASLVVKIDKILYREASWAISWWVYKSLEFVEQDTVEEEYFYQIFNLILQYTSLDDEPQEDTVSYSINHPVGIMTGTLMEKFSKKSIMVDGGIPDGVIKECLGLVISSDKDVSLVAKNILSSRLMYFYEIDSEWTRSNLLPLFAWTGNKSEIWVWQGYLRNPRMSLELANDLKSYLFNILKNKVELKKSKKMLIKMCGFICLEFQDVFSKNDIYEIFKTFSDDDLSILAEYLWRNTKDHENKDDYWKDNLKPFIRKWPKNATLFSNKVSQYLSLLVIEFDLWFEEVLETIEAMLVPFEEAGYFYDNLEEKQLVSQKPLLVLSLLSSIFTDKYGWPPKNLRQILVQIAGADSSLTNDPSFIRIDDYLIRNQL